jgi:hypothetical protein
LLAMDLVSDASNASTDQPMPTPLTPQRRGCSIWSLWARCSINALAVRLLGLKRQPESFVDNPGEKAAHRMLLPASCFHDRGDRRAPRPANQSDDGGLLGIGSRLSRAG